MQNRSTAAQALGLIGWLAVAFATAAVGAAASIQAASFYAQLVRPSWAPPGGVFAPVWTTLYTMMGVAAWLAWREGGKRTRVPLVLFVTQLAANALWSWLFFGWHLGAWACAEVLVLLALIAATLIGFWRIRPLAGMLLVPYLAWVAFASALTWSVWRNNPGALG
ncbi:MAG: TspO/MBR family protein [Ramlibacter sp.]